MKEYKLINVCLYFSLSFFTLIFTPNFSFGHQIVIEKVVAVVNNEVLTLTELNDEYEKALKTKQDVTKQAVLNEMIDRLLLNKEAQKFSSGETFQDHNELIKYYIDRRIRAFTRIPFENIEAAYNENKDKYGDKKFYEVKEEIEKELIEIKVKRRIKEQKERLRKEAIIKINPLDSLAEPLWK